MNRKLTVKKLPLVLAGEFAAFGAGAVILLMFIASTLDVSLMQTGQQAAVITSVLTELANNDRSDYHIPELQLNPTLTAIAQAKANDMASKGYFAHTSPEGKNPWYWFKQGGYSFTYAGENLAVDFTDSIDVERAWMNSPTHRANILDQHFTEIGIATAIGTYQGHRTVFVVQEFGTPTHTAGVSTPKQVAATPKPTYTAPVITQKPAPKPAQPVIAVTKPTATSAPIAVTAPTTVLGSSAEGLSEPEPSTYSARNFNGIWNGLAASPRTSLRYTYYFFAVLILIALLARTRFEFRRHHRKHVAIAVALIAVMGGLFLVADAFVFSTPTIVDRGVTATGA